MSADHAGARRRASGFGARLLLAQALLLVAGAVTAYLVASAVGPGLFHEHLLEAGTDPSGSETYHLEMAFRDALLVAMGVALLISVVAALAVSTWFARRVQRSTRRVVDAAADVAAGRYSVRVPTTGLGVELDRMSSTINELAARLEDVEATRRRLLSDLGHEMRTPLATVEAHLEALEDGVLTADAATIGVLRSSTRRLGRLADDLGAVSRAQEGRLDLRPEPVDLAGLAARQVAAEATAFGAEGVALRAEDGGPVPVRADVARLEQVLGNLLGNALRHTPPGGSVTVRTARVGEEAVLEVLDTGEGIATSDLPRVFERFYRADPSRTARDGGGSGLGLTISRAIAEAHGGTLAAASEGTGRGTTLTLRLPIDPGA